MPPVLSITRSVAMVAMGRCCCTLTDGLRKGVTKRSVRRGTVIGVAAIGQGLHWWRTGDCIYPRHWGLYSLSRTNSVGGRLLT